MEFISPLQNQGTSLSQLTERKLDRLKNEASSLDSKTDEELKQLAQQFESIFVNQLLKSMRQTIPKSGLMDSFWVDMYESMFDQEVAGEMAKSKSIGLADVLYSQLHRLQEDKLQAESALKDSVSPLSPEASNQEESGR